MRNYIYILLAFLIYSCKSDKFANQPKSEASTIVQGEDVIHINNSFYKHFLINNNNILDDVILKINQEEIITKGTKNSLPHLYIEPYNTETKWKISTKGNDIDVQDNTLTTIFNAQGEIEDTYGLYNLETGKHLFDCTYDILKVKIPQSNFKRYIGYTSRLNANQLLKNEQEDVVGIVSFASENNLIKQFIIKSTADIGLSTPDMELVSFSEDAKLFEGNQVLYFWDLDNDYKETDINFAFGYTYFVGPESEETAIMFEVKDDKLLLKNTKFDSRVFEIIEK